MLAVLTGRQGRLERSFQGGTLPASISARIIFQPAAQRRSEPLDKCTELRGRIFLPRNARPGGLGVKDFRPIPDRKAINELREASLGDWLCRLACPAWTVKQKLAQYSRLNVRRNKLIEIATIGSNGR